MLLDVVVSIGLPCWYNVELGVGTLVTGVDEIIIQQEQYLLIIYFCLPQCFIGDGDIIMNCIMKVSAIIQKYTASSENNCYQNNNRELSKTTMQNIHI